jgi:squalene-associated FAD-dependent desaturase
MGRNVTESSPVDVLVIGGGVAGLAAATRAAEAGCSVTVTESAAALGGRMRSFVDQTTGHLVDNGMHLFMGCYHQARAFLERIGRAHLVAFEPLRVVYSQLDPVRCAVSADGDGTQSAALPMVRRYELREARLPSPLHVTAGLLRFRALSFVERLAALRVGMFLRAGEPSSRWARRSSRAWLDYLGQPPHTQRVLWDPLIAAMLNVEPEQAPADLVARALRRTLAGGRQDSQIGLATVGLSELYAEAGAEYLNARGGRVRTLSRVDRLLIDGDRVRGVLMRDGRRRPARAVISAVPHSAAARLIADPEWQGRLGLSRLPELGTSGILSVTFWLDREVLDEPMLNLVDSPTQWVFNRSAIWSNMSGRLREDAAAPPALPRVGQVLTTIVSASSGWAALKPRRIIERTRAHLLPHLPLLARAEVIHARSVHEKKATFAARPGCERLRLACRTPLDGFFLAGDWTDTGLPATIEGAAQSGHVAADAALAALREGA